MSDPSSDDLLSFCGLHLSVAESADLVEWIAQRVRRPPPLAGSWKPRERLRRVLNGYLDADQRAALLAWMRRRQDRGESLIPK